MRRYRLALIHDVELPVRLDLAKKHATPWDQLRLVVNSVRLAGEAHIRAVASLVSPS